MLMGLIDIAQWIADSGVWVVLLIIGGIVCAESGLLVGIFLPGDTLLFACGIVAAQGDLPLGWLLTVVFTGAVIGDNMGYFFGRKTGQRLAKRRDNAVFRKEYLHQAEAYFARYGQITVLFARFVPYVRTFAPIVAGMGHMERRKFIAYNFVGAGLWTIVTVMIGYWLGKRIPNIQEYMVPAIIIAILLFGSSALLRVHIVRRRRRRLKR